MGTKIIRFFLGGGGCFIFTRCLNRKRLHECTTYKDWLHNIRCLQNLHSPQVNSALKKTSWALIYVSDYEGMVSEWWYTAPTLKQKWLLPIVSMSQLLILLLISLTKYCRDVNLIQILHGMVYRVKPRENNKI